LGRKNRRLKIKEAEHLQLVEESINLKRKRSKEVTITPRNLKQRYLLSLLENPNKHINFAIGPAGTGKTLISTLFAIKKFREGEIKKIVITRPAVSVDEQHGFLPGTLVEKMSPWTRPMFDIFEEYYAPYQIETMVKDNVIEIAPLAYMRGRTFKNALIIADEMQNATDSQMKMLLTRLGENSKMVVTGDLEQHDRGYHDNGLKMFVDRLVQYQSDMIGVVEFTSEEVERHPVVSEVLDIYANY
jgi:phosphate starvation-inducible protein PhoH and related proteins